MSGTWQRGSKKPREYLWFAVPLRRGTYCLGRMVAARDKCEIAYFFPPELTELPPVEHLAGLGPRDAFTMEDFSLLGIENDGWPVLSGYDLDADPWPLVEVETRPSKPGRPFRRIASRIVDEGRCLKKLGVRTVPELEYDLRPQDSVRGAQSLQGYLGGELYRIGRDGFERGQFWDPLERIGATYPLERVDRPPPRPDRLILVRVPTTADDPLGLANQAGAGDWCDRLDALFASDPTIEVDGWEVGDDDHLSVFVYGTDPKRVIRQLQSQTSLFPAGSTAVVEPHGRKPMEVALA